jgi:Bacterial SH3 domain
MTKTLAVAAIALIAAIASAKADCIVADPTPTPLNARTAPNGRIIGPLANGQVVKIIDHASDGEKRPWVYVSDPETDQPIGWVFRRFIVCNDAAR